MRALPAITCAVLLGACTETRQEGGAPDLYAAEALVQRLDQAFNASDADAYLTNFEPENRQLYQILEERIRAALGGAVRLERSSEIRQTRTVNDRLVALVTSETRTADGSSEVRVREDAYLVSKLMDDRAVGALMVEVDSGLLDLTLDDKCMCPACNYQVAGAEGWLAVAHRRDRTACMEAISFYLLGTDLSLDVSVFVDAGPMAAEPALRSYLELVAVERPALRTKLADLVITPWVPPAYGSNPPEGLDGARTELRLPNGQLTRHHLVTLGALRYLLDLRGDDLDSEPAQQILYSFSILNPAMPLAQMAERPVAAHTGGSFDGDRYVNDTFDVTLTGPAGWTHSAGALGCLFEVTYRCPQGKGELWLTAFGPQPGLSSWSEAVADSWLRNYCEASGMDITGESDWEVDARTGFQVRDLHTSAPDGNPITAPRRIRMAMADNLLLVLNAYGVDAQAEALIATSFASLGR